MVPVDGIDLQVRKVEVETPVLPEGRLGFDLEEYGSSELDRITVDIKKLDSQGEKLDTIPIDETGELVEFDLGGNPWPDALDRALRTKAPRLEGEHQKTGECETEA